MALNYKALIHGDFLSANRRVDCATRSAPKHEIETRYQKYKQRTQIQVLVLRRTQGTAMAEPTQKLPASRGTQLLVHTTEGENRLTSDSTDNCQFYFVLGGEHSIHILRNTQNSLFSQNSGFPSDSDRPSATIATEKPPCHLKMRKLEKAPLSIAIERRSVLAQMDEVSWIVFRVARHLINQSSMARWIWLPLLRVDSTAQGLSIYLIRAPGRPYRRLKPVTALDLHGTAAQK
jgi:hypothetical protein